MTTASARSGGTPLTRAQAVVDCLETPTLARIYASAWTDGPITISTLIDELDIPQGTAYEYVDRLKAAHLVELVTEAQPHAYPAQSLALTLTTDGQTQEISPSGCRRPPRGERGYRCVHRSARV